MHILGPVSLTEHISKDYKKHIYIFGDLHTFNEGCKEDKKDIIRIDTFFQQLLSFYQDEDKDKIIDLFLEVPYLPKDSETIKYEYRTEAGYLFGHVIPTFSNCLQVIKSNCEYPNTRFHYTDIRFLDLRPFINLNYLTSKIELISKDIEDFWETNLTNKEARLTLENMGKKINKFLKNLPFNVDEILKNTKIQKQIDNIPYQKIREIMNLKIKELKNKEGLVSQGHNFVRSLEYLTTKEGRKEFLKQEDGFNELYDSFDEIHSKLMDYHCEFMDIFLMSRVFRTFKDGSEPEYILIYAGDDHANSYRSFLSEIGFKEINRIEDENQCLDISKFKFPFFSP